MKQLCAATHESGSVKVFGWWPMMTAARTPRGGVRKPPRKPREGIRQALRREPSKIKCRSQFRFRSRAFSKNLCLEYVHNFGVMARVLLNGEVAFCPHVIS